MPVLKYLFSMQICFAMLCNNKIWPYKEIKISLNVSVD